MKEIKQNKNSSVKRIACFLLSSFVLLISISVPAFATQISTDLSGQPVDCLYNTSWSKNDFLSNGFLVSISTSYSPPNNRNVLGLSSLEDDVYLITVNGITSYFVCANNPNLTVYFGSGAQNTFPWSTTASWSQDNDYGTDLYYFHYSRVDSYTGPTNYDVYVPSYSSLEAALNAVSSTISGGGSSSSPHPVNFSLQPGYVAFVDISNLTGVSTNLATSVFGSAEWSPRVTDQSIGVVSSVPSSFSIPISGTSRISWTGTGSKNVLGQYKNFAYSYNSSAVGGSSYICIVNPLQASQGSQLTAMASMPSARNNPISVSVSSARQVKIYSLTSSLALGSGTLDTESDGNTWSGSPDENGMWSYSNDQTGTPTDIDSLPVGGGNEPIIGQTSINDWLQEIANSIKGFFSGAIGAVTTLVSAGSDFMHELMGLYSWLPAPVYAVLTSALILVITIGVIKVFI